MISRQTSAPSYPKKTRVKLSMLKPALSCRRPEECTPLTNAKVLNYLMSPAQAWDLFFENDAARLDRNRRRLRFAENIINSAQAPNVAPKRNHRDVLNCKPTLLHEMLPITKDISSFPP